MYGCYPIAQCQDPYSVVGYLAQHMDPPLQKILKLTEKNIGKEHLQNSCIELNNNLNIIKNKHTNLKTSNSNKAEMIEVEEDIDILDLCLRSDDLLIHDNDDDDNIEDDELMNDNEKIWSALKICENFADKRNWRLKKGKLDIYRAANYILRLALAGKEDVCLVFWPPDEKSHLNI